MTSLALLPTALDQPDGHPLGAKVVMVLIAAVFVAAFVVMALVGSARAKRRMPQEPVYPILEPPAGRTEQPPSTSASTRR